MIRVGTRVKIVREVDGFNHIPIGAESIVTGGLDYHVTCGLGLVYGYCVAWTGLDERGRQFTEVICRPEEIEPILPEGMKPAEWSDCLWQPESEAVTV